MAEIIRSAPDVVLQARYAKEFLLPARPEDVSSNPAATISEKFWDRVEEWANGWYVQTPHSVAKNPTKVRHPLRVLALDAISQPPRHAPAIARTIDRAYGSAQMRAAPAIPADTPVPSLLQKPVEDPTATVFDRPAHVSSSE